MLLALAAAPGCNSILGPTAPDENWRRYESAHFTLLARPGSFAEQQSATLAEVLEDQYAATQAALGAAYTDRIWAFLYTSAADAGLPSDRSGVAYPMTSALRVTCVAPLDENLYSVLGHEANHVIEKNLIGRPGTSFMNEGLASALLSEHYHHNGPTYLHAWSAAHLAQIPAISDLADDDRWEGFEEHLAYTASGSFEAYVHGRFGAAVIRQIYVAPSGQFAPRFEQAAGLPLAEADRNWRAFLQSSAGAVGVAVR